MTVLGIDLGTSGVKAVLIDEDQALVGQATAPLGVSRPQSGWSEQDPADWIAATRDALKGLSVKHDLKNVVGIGLSGQMHGATLVDTAGEPLRPSILWNDTRAAAEAAELDANPDFRRLSGNIVFPGFTAPKLVWVKRNEPELFDKVAMVLLPKDYLRLWLTGETISDMSDSAGTSWLNVAARDWSKSLLDASGVRRDQMPELVEGSAIGGRLRKAVADETGLNANIPVAGGGGDNAASACGIGALGNGSFLSLGTSGVLFASNDAYRPNAESAVHAFCHSVPETWHQMGVILSATDSLNWFAGLMGESPEALTKALGDIKTPGDCLFLPYLSGERTPLNDAKVRGQFIQLSHNDDREAMTRAVLDGVAFAFRDCLDALAEAGTDIEQPIAIGGGSASRTWLQAIATALDRPIAIPADGDFGAAFGAARLGLCAATGADPADICTPPAIADVVEPIIALTEAYAAQHDRYKQAYASLRSLIH